MLKLKDNSGIKRVGGLPITATFLKIGREVFEVFEWSEKLFQSVSKNRFTYNSFHFRFLSNKKGKLTSNINRQIQINLLKNAKTEQKLKGVSQNLEKSGKNLERETKCEQKLSS